MFRQFFKKHKSTLKYLSQLAAVFTIGVAIIGIDHTSDAALRKDYRELHKSVGALNQRVDKTNERIDATNAATNARIDETNALIVRTNAATNARIDETNARIDGTNARIDETNARIDELTKSVNTLVAAVSELLVEARGRKPSDPIAPDDAEGHAKDTSSRIQPFDPDAGSLARSGLSNCASRAKADLSGPKAWVAPVNLFRRAELLECRTTRSD